MTIPECEFRVAPVFGNIHWLQYEGTVDLFVAELYGMFGYEEVRLVLFDHATKRVTENSPEIFSKWRMMAKDSSLRGRFLQFEDVDRDGRKEIAALEYMHNETLYNGEAIHYFSVDETLSLREILVLEVETLIPIDPGGTIQRAVEWVDENSLDLIVNELDRSGRLVEKETRRLTRGSRFEPYHLAGTLEEQDHGWFGSGCEGTSANEFLAHGCGWRYLNHWAETIRLTTGSGRTW